MSDARPRLSRRSFLRGGAAVAGGLLGGIGSTGCGSAGRGSSRYSWPTPRARRQPGSRPFPHRPAGEDSLSEIEALVVLMMENHSFDNYLGVLGRGDGFTTGAGGQPTNWNPTASGRRLHAFKMPTDCQLDGKPSQTWLASHEQYAGGTNLGFVRSASGPVAMGYWDETALPFYYSLASTFPLADRWFCSLLGQTFPNRRYLTAATSAGMVDDIDAEVLTDAPHGTIFDRLDQHGIDWRDYYHPGSVATADVWYRDKAVHSSHVVTVEQFFSDARAGRLPPFSIVDPDFSTGSEENPQDIAVGEAFAAQVISAVMEGPQWERILLVWTYDEHGGYYDHVPPPPALAPDAIRPLSPVGPGGEKAYDGFHRYGFRVPAVVVSPYARAHHVTHAIHDHTSILAMLERKWNLPALTYRDANAADLRDFLDLSRRAFAVPPRLATPRLPTPTCTPGEAGVIPPTGSST